jgi:hypothetical protein
MVAKSLIKSYVDVDQLIDSSSDYAGDHVERTYFEDSRCLNTNIHLQSRAISRLDYMQLCIYSLLEYLLPEWRR